MTTLIIYIPTGNNERACYLQPPVIPGHEFAGEVVQLGEGELLITCFQTNNY